MIQTDLPDLLDLHAALVRCKTEIGDDPTWDDEQVMLRAGDVRTLIGAIEALTVERLTALLQAYHAKHGRR